MIADRDRFRIVSAQEISPEHLRHAKRLIKKLQSNHVSMSKEILPLVGALRDPLQEVIEAVEDAGPLAVQPALDAMSGEYPILKDLTKQNKYQPLKISELLAMQEQSWLLTNFLYEDSISVVYGPPGSYKSFVVLDWMCHIALGRHWKLRKVRQCRIIYLAAEGVRGYQRRIRAWCHHFQISPEDLEQYITFVPLAVPLGNAAEVGDFIEALQELQDEYDDGLPIIIVLDTLFQCAAGENVNASEVMTKLVATAQQIKTETKAIHLLIVHHSGKDKERGMSGNLALKGSTDMSFFIEADKDGLITLRSDKIKDDEPSVTYLQKVRVEYGDGERDNSCVVVASEKPVAKPQLNANQQIILDALPEVLPGLSYSEILKNIMANTNREMAKTTFNDNIKKLIDIQMVVKTSLGAYYKFPCKDEEADGE